MNLFLLQGSANHEYFLRMFLLFGGKLILVFWIGLAALSSHLAFGQPGADVTDWGKWQTTKDQYDLQKYEAALKDLQGNFREEAAYYYNVGTLYSQLGKEGMGIGYLEKAARMSPGDPDIQYNLSFARSSLKKNLGTNFENLPSNWLEQWGEAVSHEQGLSLMAFSLVWMFASCIFVYAKRRKVFRMSTSPAVIPSYGLFLIALGTLVCQKWAENHPLAICIERQSVRSGPGHRFLELTQLESGASLRILGPSVPVQANQSSESWRQVRYSKEGIGWMDSSKLLTP